MATLERALPLEQANRPEGPPIFVGFRTEIVPALTLLWTGITIAFIVSHESYLWPAAVWASVTTIMLWPAGRALGHPYFSYRTPLFVLGVISMGYILFTGFSMRTGWAYEVKLGIFLALPVVLSVFAIIPGLPWAISRPIRMFFRPDLLFGDGRVLVGGVISLVLGMRYLVGQTPPDVDVPVPANWSWYGILFAMAAGFIMIIPLRGIAKLLTRMTRVKDGKLTGWLPLFAKELFLVLALLSIGYGFHNVFAGKVPLRWNLRPDADGFWPAIGIVLGAALWIIVVRGAYKKLIVGDPFIRETFSQSLVKHALLLVGIGVLFYGFMSLMHFDAQHVAMNQDQLRGFNDGKSLAAAIPLMAFGTLLLVPVRAYIQDVQRRAILAQMASTILPTQPEPARRRVMGTMMRTLVELTADQRQRLMRAMIEGLDGASPEVRALMTRTRVEILASMPADDRQALMAAQAAALREVEEPVRVRAMSDMMSAVSQLPEEQRRAVMQQMASLVG